MTMSPRVVQVLFTPQLSGLIVPVTGLLSPSPRKFSGPLRNANTNTNAQNVPIQVIITETETEADADVEEEEEDEDEDAEQITISINKTCGYITLLGGSMMQLCAGSMYSFGNLLPYMASYWTHTQNVLNQNQLSMAELQSTYAQLISQGNWIFFVLIISMTVSVIFGGNLEIKIGARKTLVSASILMSFGFGLTFFALMFGNGSGLYYAMVTLGVLWGSGIGLAYPILIVVSMRWFPSNRGLVAGICSGIYGAGAFLFDSIETQIINPANLAMDPSIGYTEQPLIIERIPLMFVYCGLIMLSMQMIALFSIRNPPWHLSEEKIARLKARLRESQSRRVGRRSTDPDIEFITKELDKTKSQMIYEADSLNIWQTIQFSAFWHLLLLTAFYMVVTNMVAMQWKVFAMDYLLIENDQYLSLIGGLSSLFNGLARVFWGNFYDCCGHSFRLSQSLMAIILGSFVATWPLCSYSPNLMFAIWSFVIWTNVNCNYAFLPSVISRVFGAKHVGSIIGCIIMVEIGASFFITICAEHIQDWFLGWNNYLLMIGGFSLLTTIFTLFYNPHIDRKEFLFGVKNLKRTPKKSNARLLSVFFGDDEGEGDYGSTDAIKSGATVINNANDGQQIYTITAMTSADEEEDEL